MSSLLATKTSVHEIMSCILRIYIVRCRLNIAPIFKIGDIEDIYPQLCIRAIFSGSKQRLVARQTRNVPLISDRMVYLVFYSRFCQVSSGRKLVETMAKFECFATLFFFPYRLLKKQNKEEQQKRKIYLLTSFKYRTEFWILVFRLQSRTVPSVGLHLKLTFVYGHLYSLYGRRRHIGVDFAQFELCRRQIGVVHADCVRIQVWRIRG